MNTLDYYNNNAKKYFETTINANMKLHYDIFLKYLDNGSLILDFGCGSGRDSKYFLDNGYNVDSIDGSQELCNLASEYLGREVSCMKFQDFEEYDKYDGVWACASLLHVKREELKSILIKIYNCLKENGILYASFKDGDSEEIINDKYYNYITKSILEILVSEIGFELIDFYNTESSINVNEERTWNNFILRKK